MIMPRLLSSLWLVLFATVVPLAAQDQEQRPDRNRSDRTDERGRWTLLFDGKSLDGWEQKNGSHKYEVQEGTIVGSTVAGSPNSFLCTQKDYGDFVLEFEVKLLRDDLNSGVQIRSQSRPDYQNGRVHGPQVEIEATNGLSGYIYGEATGRGWLTPDDERKPHEHFKKGEWNRFRVRARGNRIETWVNGEKVADLTDDESYKSGFIGLQVHSYRGEHPAQVAWRNIRIRELNGP